MTSDARIYPGQIHQDEPSFFAALRRARWMLFAMAVLTLTFCLEDTLADRGPDGWPGSLERHFVSMAFTVEICWYVFRGGKISGGCLAVGYASTFLTLVIGGGLAAGIYLALRPPTIPTLEAAGGPALSMVVTSARCVFSLWVLLGSEDVRLYREVRRLGLTPQEAFVRRGRSYGRRPQPSIHAS